MSWCEIFRSGAHTDSEGRTREWTETDLDRMIASYDPAKHEAPVVIGHPKDNAPAYGWVESLKRDGSKLLAKFRQIVPAFADAVNQGLFKKRSISVYPDGTLRHVGFLGAQPPAIKSLADFAFNDDGKVPLIFEEFIDWDKRARERLEKEKIQGDFAGPNDTFPIAGPDDIRDAWSLAGQAANPDEIRANVIRIAKKFGWKSGLPATAEAWAKDRNIDFSEKEETMPTIEELQAKLEAEQKARATAETKAKNLEDENKKLASDFAEAEKKTRRKDLEAFVQKGIQDGKMLPDWKTRGIINFMMSLEELGQTFEFSEGKKESPLTWFKAFVTSFSEHPLFKEMTKKTDDKKGRDSEFAEDEKIARRIAGVEEGK